MEHLTEMSNTEKPTRFFILLYDVSEKPSRLKVKAWRKLRILGGIYPKLSLCIIPDSGKLNEELLKALEELRDVEFTVFLSKPLREEDLKNIFQKFKESREREYLEIIEECREFLEEIERNIDTGNLTEEEYEELEEELEALNKWYRKVSERDLWEIPKKKETENYLEKCKEALFSFAEKILEKNKLIDV